MLAIHSTTCCSLATCVFNKIGNHISEPLLLLTIYPEAILLKTQSPTVPTKISIGAALGKSVQFDGINPEIWTVEGPIIKARRSEIYRASHPEIRSKLCIEYSKDGERTTKSLKQEYVNLQNFSKMMINTPFNVPKPIA